MIRFLCFFILSIFIYLQGALAFAAEPTQYDNGRGALSGYDAVAYFTQNRAIKGEQQFKYRWKEIDWYFSSVENLARFKQSPLKYAPQNGGFCSWAASRGYLASADPNAWHIENGKLYLNYNMNVLKEFRLDVSLHVKRSAENWPALKLEVPAYLNKK